MSIKSQLPQNSFFTTGIQDPVTRQNIENMNRIQSQIINGNLTFPANIIYSDPDSFSFADNSSEFPTALISQITTKGNPVHLELQSAPYDINHILGSKFSLSSIGTGSGIVTLGWFKIGNGHSGVLTSFEIEVGKGAVSSFSLPAFGYDDIVGSGTWTYKFVIFAIVRTGGSAGDIVLAMDWCRVSLKELR